MQNGSTTRAHGRVHTAEVEMRTVSVAAPRSRQHNCPQVYCYVNGFVPPSRKEDMNKPKRRIAVLFATLCMLSSLAFAACGSDEQAQQTADGSPGASSTDVQTITNDTTGEVGVEYATKWFVFTVESLTTAQSYDAHAAADGNSLAIAHVTLTNTSGSSQEFGTYDWLVDDDTLSAYLYPLDPINSEMMPSSFTLSDGETASYDVVIEYPADLSNPFFMYIEADDQGNTYGTFRIPIAQ